MDAHTQMLITALEELEQEGDWEVEPAKQPKYFIGGKPVY
jgi:hypothetical protein